MSGWKNRKRRDAETSDEISATSDATGRVDAPASSQADGLGAPPPDSEGTIDLSALQADEALLDALGGPDPDLSGRLGEQELTSLLLSWRKEADSEPIAELVDTDLAMAVIASSRSKPARRSHRFLVPVATAAAVLAIAFTGVGVAAKSAQPGDTLWSLTKVLYSEHAHSVEAADSVQEDQQAAGEAMAAGHLDDARAALDRAKKKLGSVNGDDGKAGLTDKQQKLIEKLDVSADAGANGSGSPTGSNPAGPVDPSGSATVPKPALPDRKTKSPPSAPASPPVVSDSPTTPPVSPPGTPGADGPGSDESGPPHHGRPHDGRPPRSGHPHSGHPHSGHPHSGQNPPSTDLPTT
ncbi:MAG: anti-sigma-D factor RsdA [Sciscionella sp.]